MSPKTAEVARGLSVRVATIRKLLGLSQLQLARRCARTENTIISRIEQARNYTIALDILHSLVDAAVQVGYDGHWLLTGEAVPAAQSADAAAQQERRIINHVMQALAPALGLDLSDPSSSITIAPGSPPPAQPLARHQVSRLVEPGFRTVEPEQLPDDWRRSHVPVVGRLSAGEGVDTAEAEAHPPGWADEYLLYKDAPPGAFAVRVVGQSMRPEYAEGDMIVVDPARPAERGVCVVLYRADDEACRARLKRFRRRGRQAVLESTHPDYAPVPMALDRIRACYEVYDHLPRVRTDQPPADAREHAK